MSRAWADPLSRRPLPNQRKSQRIAVSLPARLTWKDQRGSTRFASVVTRDVSDFGVYVECASPVSITQFRLVQFQLERDVREAEGVPQALREGRLLAAVYRVQSPTRTGGRQGLALRLLVDPRRHAPASDSSDAADRPPRDLVATAAAVPEHSRATA